MRKVITPLARFSVAALTILLCCALGCGKKEEAAAPAPLEIAVVKVLQQDTPINYEFTGQTKGAIDAEVRARVDGVVLSMSFEEGKPVEEGQLLYTIDPAPFEAKVTEAKSLLVEAQSRLVKADADLKRIRPLAAINAVSQRDLDSAIANQAVAAAGVKAAEASVNSAEIELSYTKITAPTSGTIGLSKAKIGEYVGKAPNPVVLNTVSKLDPIHVRFSLSEREYLYFARLRQAEIDAGQPQQKRALELTLADGSVYPEKGFVESIDRQIDPQTGSLALEAAFPNPNKLIRPGQFAKIKAVGEVIKGALLVPTRALRDLQGQQQALIIKDDQTVEVRTVKIGLAVGKMQIVESGVNAGESVAVEGLQQLKPGMKVTPILQAGE